MSVRVKICGITNLADAQVAVEAGADALGFVFYEKSPRFIPMKAAAEISKAIAAVHLARWSFCESRRRNLFPHAIGECGLSLLQFHGDEPPEFCTQFGLMSMKAFRIRDAESLKELPKYPTDAWLLDAYSSDTLGGTGEKFNWDLAVEAQKFGKPGFSRRRIDAGKRRRSRPQGAAVWRGRFERRGILAREKGSRQSARVH